MRGRGVSSIAGAAKSTMKSFNNRPDWKLLIGLAVLLCWPVLARAQTGAVTVTATVSEVVALAALPDPTARDVRITTGSDRRSLTLELSGSGPDSKTFRIPFLIRSNCGYSITSLLSSESASYAKLERLDARPTGRFVAPDAATRVIVTNPLGYVRPATMTSFLRGSRVSLAGTLDSPGNALEVTLLVTVMPETKPDNWRVQLTLSASPIE